jgi:hypothetical protein
VSWPRAQGGFGSLWCRRAPGTTRPAGWPAATVAMGSTCRPKLPVTCLGSNTGATAVPRDPAASRHSGRWGRPNLDSLARGLQIEVSPQRRAERDRESRSPDPFGPPGGHHEPGTSGPRRDAGAHRPVRCHRHSRSGPRRAGPAPPASSSRSRRTICPNATASEAASVGPIRQSRTGPASRVDVCSRSPAQRTARGPPVHPREGPQLDSPPDPHSVRGMG